MVDRFDPLAVDVPRMLAELGLPAKHDGDTWLGKCPSGRHQDKSPSWRIKDCPGEERHGLHYCQSCKFGGTAIELVRAVIGFSGTSEAITWICDNAMGVGRTFEKLTVTMSSKVAPAFRLPSSVLALPPALWAPTPLHYLVNDRKVPHGQIERYGLGYAVEGRLRGRIVFPARDANGVLLNYTARTFVGSMVRYLSAEESEGPDTAAIFGEQFWPRIDARSEGGHERRKRGVLVVTEGALNTLAVERALAGRGWCDWYVGALSGSKVQLEQVVKAASFGMVVGLTDADLAGDAAAERIEGALARHVRYHRVRLPKGKDPATVPAAELAAQIHELVSR